MKAVVLEEYGSADGLHVREVAMPTVGADTVLVEVRAASINAADWHLMHTLPYPVGALLARGRSPYVCGLDLAGRVASVGGRVTRFRAGDEVFGVGRGSCAEYAAAREDRLAAKPGSLTFAEAAAVPVAGCTALQGVRDLGRVTPGQAVVIYGAGGGVGTFAVQIAKGLGAHVTAVTSTANVDLMRSLGADEVVDYTQEDFTTRGRQYDLLVDIGANRSARDCERALKPNGRAVLVGAPDGMLPKLVALLKALLGPGGRRTGYVASVRVEDLAALGALADAGTLRPVIGRTVTLAEVPDALRLLGTRQARGKIVVTIAGPAA